MSGGTTSGAPTPCSPNFDPDASEFIPTCTSRPNHGLGLSSMTTSAPFGGSPDETQGSETSARQMTRPPLALYTCSTWSPTAEHPIKSAKVPPKQSWNSYLDHRTSHEADNSLLSPTHLHIKRSAQLHNSPLADSIPDGGPRYKRSDSSLNNGARVSPGLSGFRHTLTEDCISASSELNCKSRGNPNLTIQTGQIPQRLLGWAPSASTKSSSGQSIFTPHQVMPQTPLSTATPGAQLFSPTEQRSYEDQNLEYSKSVAISELRDQAQPEQANTKGEVWTERTHPHSIRRALKDGKVEWIEAYPGAVGVLSALNPPVYQMPFGTRVINIKTEHYRNVLKSITCGKYAVMTRVAERIMKIWTSREISSAKVFLLFSINGSKRFCGMAEMSGPWAEDDSIDEWENSSQKEPAAGWVNQYVRKQESATDETSSFPVTWVYVKDVAYHQFNHIRQPINGNPVGNMWNGMNFPPEIGRRVIQVYVETPATSSILGQPKDSYETRPLINNYPFSDQRRGNVSSLRGSRGGRSGLQASPAYAPTGYHGIEKYSSGTQDDSTPIPRNLSTVALQEEAFSKYNEPDYESEPMESEKLHPISVQKSGKPLQVPSGKLENLENPAAGYHTPHFIVAEHSDRLRNSLAANRPVSNLHYPPTSAALTQNPTAMSPKALLDPIEGGFSPQHSPVKPPQADTSSFASRSNAHFATMQSMGDYTPTHRPASRGARNVAQPGPQRSTRENVSFTDQSVNMLRAKYHRLTAEQFDLAEELDTRGLSDMKTRMASTQMCRILTEKREVQTQLIALGGMSSESTSPLRQDSFSSSDQASASSGRNTSPTATEEGKPLRSISKIMLPLHGAQAENFDRAPGGSGRHKGHAMGHNYSWDLELKKSITDLLKSPEKVPQTISKARQGSSSFADGVEDRKPHNFVTHRHTRVTPTASSAKESANISAFTPNSSGIPSALTASRSFDFATPAPHSGGINVPLGGSQSLSFPVPVSKGPCTPTASAFSKDFPFMGSPFSRSSAFDVSTGPRTPAFQDFLKDGTHERSAGSPSANKFSFHGPGSARSAR